MIIALVKLLKRTLNTKEELVTVEEEIDSVKNYALIQQHRFPCFELQVEVEDEARPLKILKLIVQPFIENAILHGFKAREDGNGVIAVRVQAWEALRVEIEDNGAGMDEETRISLLLVTDIQMPIMDGLTLIQEVRRTLPRASRSSF